ncbi:MAG: hypothetical protein D3926_10595 [Desulfobacteraceae bacterium]|nr:MAG: hypothetical protein D3926_10595 [Desulfobacteraceae bacterium]
MDMTRILHDIKPDILIAKILIADLSLSCFQATCVFLHHSGGGIVQPRIVAMPDPIPQINDPVRHRPSGRRVMFPNMIAQDHIRFVTQGIHPEPDRS